MSGFLDSGGMIIATTIIAGSTRHCTWCKELPVRLCAVFTNRPRMAGRSSEGVRVFTSTASQHGGQAITSFHRTLLHQGMIIAGAQYSEPRLVAMTEITGGRPTALPRSLRPIRGFLRRTSWPSPASKGGTSPRSSLG